MTDSTFPYTDPVDVAELLDLDDDLVLDAAQIIDLLDDQLTAQRKKRIDEVVRHRTFTVVTVLDGIYDLGNAAAVLRSAEGLGYQVAHVVDTQPHQKSSSSRITQGADKWMDVHRWSDPSRCIEQLRGRGYRVVATDLEAEHRLEDVDFTEPTALVFGNEKDGVSRKTLEMADQRCVIPVRGFVQSFNISVAAAMSLYEAMRQRTERLGGQGDLTAGQREILKARFNLRALNDAQRIVPSLWRRRRS